jgi:intracellular septation protein A
MKLKSAFAFCLALIAGCIGLAILSNVYIDTEISIFFACGATVLLMILPACSMKN